MAGPSISLKGLGKRFGGFTAIADVTLEVAEGEVFGLLGPNGAGKTTLTRMLCGLLRPSMGEGLVAGHTLGGDARALAQDVGLLTEQPGLYDRLTALENLRFAAGLYRVPKATAEERIERYLQLFGLWEKREVRAGTFSKGQRQKLAIARALLHAPKVILLDEPTSGLDPQAARAVREAVAELAREGRTLLLCSHNLDEVERLCARVAVVKQRVLALGPVSELRKGKAQADIVVEGEAATLIPGLQGIAGLGRVLATGNSLSVMLDAPELVAEVVARLVGQGARIRSVVPQARALEDVYLEMVGTPGEKAA